MKSINKEMLLSKIASCDDNVVKQMSDIINDVFYSIQWIPIKDDVIQISECKCIEEWNHRTFDKVELDIDCLNINRIALIDVLERYIEINHSKIRELDWLFVDILIYAEYIATIEFIHRKLVNNNLNKKTFFNHRTKNLSIETMISRWWHFPLSISALSVSLFFQPVGPIAVILYIIYRIYKRKKFAKEINCLLESMFSTYSSLNTINFGWGNLQHSLYESKKFGAVWDSSLFCFIERRISSK